MTYATLARDLLGEARRTNERRAIVLTGDQEATLSAAADILETTAIGPAGATLVGRRDVPGVDRVPPERAATLLGTTAEAVIVDAHAGLDPNVVGRTVGAVAGGGLYLLCCPDLEDWPERVDPFDETLAVPPFTAGDVGGRFRRRFVRTLRSHPGIAIVDPDAGRIERDGLTHPAPRLSAEKMARPTGSTFPVPAFDACETADQVEALGALEALLETNAVAVVEADRGRGKSSVVGLAAGALAARGDTVAVTAPEYRSAAEVFARAEELLGSLDALGEREGTPPQRLSADPGGEIRFSEPNDVVDAIPEVDVLVVDEAAAIGVDLLTTYLRADRVAFVTTVHGYEGAGRGFSVRFRDRLAASDRPVTDVRLDEPIRYAPGDPVEVWAFHALLLNASPAPAQIVSDARPGTVTYRRLSPNDLLANEPRLREAFGLLVLAHYRTEPADVARLLDAPNVRARALTHNGHVVAIALLAREGGLPASLRTEMYEGARVRGNLIPDVLTTQLRDEAAGEAVGWRVMRIATHSAVRSRGLGTHLLDRISEEFAPEVDWLGVGYGATPRLLSFWRENGFGTVHLSLTRNDTSGEHSTVMLDPVSEAGEALHDRHARWFLERTVATLTDAHRDLDPDLVRSVLASVAIPVDPDLSAEDWRRVAGMAYGPGLVDVDPRPFRRLAIAHLVEPAEHGLLSARQERLLVLKVLQGREWDVIVDRLGFPSRGQGLRALGEAYRPLVDVYGSETALVERDRYDDGADAPGET